MPPQLREIGFHVQNHATQWHGFQHEIQFQEVVVAWIQLTQKKKLLRWRSGILPTLGTFYKPYFVFHKILNDNW